MAAGRLLPREGRGEASIAHFQDLATRYPEDPRAHFELACAFDREGREEEAVLPYWRAFALGLRGEDLATGYVGLGSTLRNVGQPDEAVRVLSEGHEQFPADGAIRVFLALARFSAGDAQAALVELLDLLLATPPQPISAATTGRSASTPTNCAPRRGDRDLPRSNCQAAPSRRVIVST